MLKKLLPLTLCFLFLFSFPVYADIPERTQANSEIESAYGISNFYPEQINTPKGNKSINFTTYKAVDSATGGDSNYTLTDPPKVFSYGEPWGHNPRFGVDRYAGYTVQSHPLGNPEHPFDNWTGGIYEEKPGRIKEPWKDERVQNFLASELGVPVGKIETAFPLSLQNNTDWRGHFMWGLMYDKYNGESIINPMKYPDEPWEEYVLVYHPPTNNSWGWGRMFREENGSILYKTVWIVDHIPSVPDFFPTPEGETEWQEKFLECAKTYTGKPGEEITFPVTLTNQGEKGTTDFMAVWEGQGDDPENGWQGTNPPWKADEPITLAKGESVTLDVTVNVPQIGEPTKLFFKANVDGKTPSAEMMQDNNMMAIIVQPTGIDLEIESDPTMVIQALAGVAVNVRVPMMCYRNDFDEKLIPVEAEISWTGPEGEDSKIVNLVFGDIEMAYVEFTGYAGNTYYATGQTLPTTEEDIDMSNNYTQTKVIIVTEQPVEDLDVSKENPSEETRVNLIG